MDPVYSLIMNYNGQLIVQGIKPFELMEEQHKELKIVADAQTKEILLIDGLDELVFNMLMHGLEIYSVPSMMVREITDKLAVTCTRLVHKRHRDVTKLVKESIQRVAGDPVNSWNERITSVKAAA